MLQKNYLHKKKENVSRIKISLLKSPIKSVFILSFSSLELKMKPKLNIIINKEINIKEVLNNMIIKTNKLYENLYKNQVNIKLDIEQSSKRAKIIKYIDDFIEANIRFKNSFKNKDTIFCEIIFLFDLLIINNKKNKCLIPLEKLGLGALILLLKFNKIKEKVLIKKYKSIFDSKYMSLDEINKIEVISLKLINYDITQPNPIYYIDILCKFIFFPSFNKEGNREYIYKEIISITKYLMTFSNNYIKFHPFYFSVFIIKFYLEKNKIEKFHFKFHNYFEINVKKFSELYYDFVKCFRKHINIEYFLLENKKENLTKKILNKSLGYNKSIEIEKTDEKNSTNKFSSITVSSGFCLRKDKIFSEKNNNFNLNGNIKIGMSSMNNTYYKKFLDNYFDDINSINRKTYQNILSSRIESKNKNINISLESPKNCGISIDYRIKKKTENQIDNNEIRKNKNISIGTIFENKIKENKEFMNEYLNKNNKRLNSELTEYNFYFRGKGNSIRKMYKNKNKEKNYNENLLNNNYIEIKNSQNYTKEKIKKIKVNRLNKINENNFKYNYNKIIPEEKNNNYYENDENDKNKCNIDNYLRNTVNQRESFSKGNYYIIKEENTKIFRKMNIRNFYKNKNSFTLKF